MIKKINKAIIYGCGDMGIQTYNILKHNPSVDVIGFLDDNKTKYLTYVTAGIPLIYIISRIFDLGGDFANFGDLGCDFGDLGWSWVVSDFADFGDLVTIRVVIFLISRSCRRFGY